MNSILGKIVAVFLDRNMVRRFPFLRGIRNKIGSLCTPSEAVVHGNRMFLQRGGHSLDIAIHGSYEELETSFLMQLQLSGATVLDVGSCIGYYALIMARLVGVSGHVYAFEPESKNFSLLSKNIRENRYKNVICRNIAIGDRNKLGWLHIHESPGQHFVVEERSRDLRDLRVDISSLDDQVPKVEWCKVRYVKIDAEGSELDVLRGMEGILVESSGLIIQMEFAPQHLSEQENTVEQMVSFFRGHQLMVSYWNMDTCRLEKINDLNWLRESQTIRDFEKGLKYSRNLILQKMRSYP